MPLQRKDDVEGVTRVGDDAPGPPVEERWIGMRPWVEQSVNDPPGPGDTKKIAVAASPIKR